MNDKIKESYNNKQLIKIIIDVSSQMGIPIREIGIHFPERGLPIGIHVKNSLY